RTSQRCGVLEVVEDEQGVPSPVEFLEHELELTVARLGPNIRTKPAAYRGQSLGQRVGGVDPEDAIGITVPIAIDVFHGELGLAAAARAAQARRADADRPRTGPR